MARKKTKKVEKVPEVVPELSYTGPMVLMLENPSQIEYLKNLLIIPQTIDMDTVIKERVLECIYQSVPLPLFRDALVQNHLNILREIEQKKVEDVDYQKKIEDYEKNKDPTAQPIVANTPQTVLKIRNNYN